MKGSGRAGNASIGLRSDQHAVLAAAGVMVCRARLAPARTGASDGPAALLAGGLPGFPDVINVLTNAIFKRLGYVLALREHDGSS
jgi:hypothetical protein